MVALRLHRAMESSALPRLCACSSSDAPRVCRTIAGMAMSCALSGCVVGPNYQQPEMSLTALHSTPSDRQETSRPSLDSWWTDLHDSLLTQTIREALAQNLDLAASLERVEQARAAAREAGASWEADLFGARHRAAQAAGADAHDLSLV
jgi:hypothetical protein